MAQSESCCNCVYSYWDRRQAIWSLSAVPTRPACANHPESLGRMKECPPGRVCPNFRAQPPTPKGEMVKMIPLGGGVYAYVDAADYEWLSRWTWSLRGGYAARLEKRKLIYMHREIMQPPEGMIVDHQNLSKLDNTRVNLRVCTHQENACNRSKKRGTLSRFRGVNYSKDCGKYRADIYYKGQNFFLGYFTDEIEAARAHDRKAVELSPEFARLNFPEEWPGPRRAELYAQRDAAARECEKAGGSEGKKVERREGKTAKAARPRATSDERRDRAKGRSKRAKGRSQKAKSWGRTPKIRDPKAKG
jgi:hypothetical protein